MLRLVCWLTALGLEYLAVACEDRGWVTEPKVFRSASHDVRALRG